MPKCCLPFPIKNLIYFGGGDPPPVLSDYCIQWTVQPTTIFFPCGENSNVNGNTNPSVICGGQFTIPDLNGVVGNTFFYQSYNSNNWYAQVIRPAANAALLDLGYYAYEIFGTPIGPFPIDITNTNCVLNTYSATFNVPSVNTQGFTEIILQVADRYVDLIGFTAFSNAGAAAAYLAQLISVAGLEPSAVVTVTINSPTNVTLTIQTILTLFSGGFGDATTTNGTFTFVLQ